MTDEQNSELEAPRQPVCLACPWKPLAKAQAEGRASLAEIVQNIRVATVEHGP